MGASPVGIEAQPVAAPIEVQAGVDATAGAVLWRQGRGNAVIDQHVVVLAAHRRAELNGGELLVGALGRAAEQAPEGTSQALRAGRDR
ncbi:MAG: hypothetical protein Q8O42_17005 [Acidobacteriota bacterium]|nr:hypothetical protein [Acidobacteriota bacterium]